MSNVFHDHLDACERCRARPFDLCPEGARKLAEAAAGVSLAPPLETPTTYEIVENGQAIKCLRCGRTSWSPKDVQYRYCGGCTAFH